MTKEASPEFSTEAGAALLDWYDRHHRELAWRVSPSRRAQGVAPEPYHVWLSEVMLQQTTVRAVDAYFRDFLKRWPTVADLAAADESEVMKAWAGLGYYSRARNLKKCADRLVAEHGGTFPDTFEGLRALPGIGDYTAAAIAAIAFDRREPVVDGNVERVVSRLFAIATPLPAARTEIRARVAQIMPTSRPGDFAQAMMDLGATICTPKRPACVVCPVAGNCEALDGHDPERFPLKAPKRGKPVRRGAAFVAQDPSGAILLRRRPPSGLLGGMSEVPTSGWTARADGTADESAAPFAADWRETGTIRHVFTHFELLLTVFHARIAARPVLDGGWWSAADALSGEALPTVMKKAVAAALPDAFKQGPPPRATRQGASMKPEIRHVVFDIGKVLIHYDPELPYRTIIPDAEERRWFLENVCTNAWNLEQDRGRSWAEAESVLIERFPDHAENIRAFRSNWSAMVPHAYGDSVAIMEGLIDEGHDVTMLTNFASDTFAEARRRFDFLHRPRGVTVSGDISLIKPDRAIYDRHAADFDLDPAATLFIDDSAPNVEGARAAGWHSVQFKNAETLKADLERFYLCT